MSKKNELIKLGERIRKLRNDRGYSQESFANEAGLARSFFGCIERGEKNVSAINLIKIATALKLQVGDLFPMIEYIGKMDSDEK